MLTPALKKQIAKAAGTYLRAFLAAAIAVYISGTHDWQAIVNAGIAAVLPVILRALNPGDGGYGITNTVNEPFPIEETPAE